MPPHDFHRSSGFNLIRARAAGPAGALRLLLLLLVFPISGCGGGGGGGNGVSAATRPVQISQVVVTPDPLTTRIAFNVVSPDNQPVDVKIQYSENRGTTYREATITGIELVALPATSDGTDFQALWNPSADLSSMDQADLRIRVVPTNNVTGEQGESGDSTTFGLGDNSPPTIDSVATPTGTQGGKIELTYEIWDSGADYVGVEIECSIDGGATWIPGTVAAGGNGGDAVPTATTAVTRTLFWNAQVDLDPGTTSARVRLTPRDVVQGTSAQTGDFTLNLRAPTVTLLSVGQIDRNMNGSQSYESDSGETVSVGMSAPSSDFRITVDYAANFAGGDLDLNSLVVTASQPFGELVAGTNLASRFTKTDDLAFWDVSAAEATNLGQLDLTASIADEYGNVSNEATYSINIVTADGLYRPFEISDLWHLNFETDLFATTYSGGSSVSIQSSLGGNGIADFTEDLFILGLQTNSPTAECDALGSNAILANWAVQETVGRVNELFGRDFDGTGTGFHANLLFSTSATGARSSVRIGGDDANPGFTLGRAQFDYRNVTGNSNTSSTLGVFLTNMIQFYVNASFTFRNRFDPLIEGRGTPAGEGALDHIVLAPSFDRLDPDNTVDQNSRYDEIYRAIDGLARSVAVITAHEIGHSIGLCANGVPPAGLFGGVDDAPFAGSYTTDFHFDSSGNNVMAAALSFSTSMVTGDSGYQFNELNEAYLREWIILQE